MSKLSFNNAGQWSLQKNSIGVDTHEEVNEPEFGHHPKGRDKKVKFDPKADQKGFQEYVDNRADHIPTSGYAIGKVTDFIWTFETDYQTSKTNQIKRDWPAWYEGELDEWRYDRGNEKAGHFEAWAKDPNHKPIILVEGTDGKPHVWDGHHRVGMAHIKKMKQIPVLYGTRKKK